MKLIKLHDFKCLNPYSNGMIIELLTMTGTASFRWS